MKASVDKNTCIGCGLCAAICPEVFEMSDEGVSEVYVDELTEPRQSLQRKQKASALLAV